MGGSWRGAVIVAAGLAVAGGAGADPCTSSCLTGVCQPDGIC